MNSPILFSVNLFCFLEKNKEIIPFANSMNDTSRSLGQSRHTATNLIMVISRQEGNFGNSNSIILAILTETEPKKEYINGLRDCSLIY